MRKLRFRHMWSVTDQPASKRQSKTRNQVYLPLKYKMGILWDPGPPASKLPEVLVKMQSPEPHFRLYESLNMVYEVPPNLAFAPLSNFILAGPLHCPCCPLHTSVHIADTHRGVGHTWNMLAPYPCTWTRTIPSQNNSTPTSSHLPSLVKFLLSFKFQFKRQLLWEPFLLPLPQIGCCCFWAFLGTSQRALFHT